jgi:hypothetical protein
MTAANVGKMTPPTLRVHSKLMAARDPTGPLRASPGKVATPAATAERVTPRRDIWRWSTGTEGAKDCEAMETVHVAEDSDASTLPVVLRTATTTGGEKGMGSDTDAGRVAAGGACRNPTVRRWTEVRAVTGGSAFPRARHEAVSTTACGGSDTDEGSAGRRAIPAKTSRPVSEARAVAAPVSKMGAPLTVPESEHESSDVGLALRSFQVVRPDGGVEEKGVAGSE